MATDRNYHHGDLRAALIARACEVVESQGHEAVSLRALAEELGVSRGAPYRHFPERDQLLAEIASIGFERLAAITADAPTQPLAPPAMLLRAGQGFLQFVEEQPQMFRLIYESGLMQRADTFPHLAAMQSDVYQMIFSLYAAAAAGLDLTHKQLQARMIAFWSTIFGYAKIRQAALLQPYMKDELAEPEIMAQVIRTAIGPDIVGN
jgi:AcrR family transcriptional regulator